MDRLFESLGIDLWSIVTYMANTGVVLVALFFLAYKPILKYIDERRNTIRNSIEEAKILREEFAKEAKNLRLDRDKVERDLRQEMALLHKSLEEKRLELNAEMDAARTKMLAKTNEEIQQKKAALIKEAEKEVMGMMTRVILEIVQNKVPEKVIQESISEAWRHERSLPA